MSKHGSRSPFLPVGIAMILLAGGFTFGDQNLQWLWRSEPHVAILLVVVGAVLLAAHWMKRRGRPA